MLQAAARGRLDANEIAENLLPKSGAPDGMARNQSVSREALQAQAQARAALVDFAPDSPAPESPRECG